MNTKTNVLTDEDVQYLKDEHEQAIERGGRDYATGYVEGLKDGKWGLNVRGNISWIRFP